MSHFTHIKTCFQNLFYLEKALNKLNISHTIHRTQDLKGQSMRPATVKISQLTGSDIEFTWNGQEYELIFDKSFWTQTTPTNEFKNKITHQYASEVIIGETQKIGFKPVKNQKNPDGSTTLILERWNLGEK